MALFRCGSGNNNSEIYDALILKGITPDSKSTADIVSAINSIRILSSLSISFAWRDKGGGNYSFGINGSISKNDNQTYTLTSGSGSTSAGGSISNVRGSIT